MIEKSLEILFKIAGDTVEAIQNAGSHEEVDTFADALGNILNGIHDIVKAHIQ